MEPKRKILPEQSPVIEKSHTVEQELMHDEEVQQLRDAVMRLRPEEQEVFCYDRMVS